MKYRNLGKSGLQVSRVCLGGNSWGSKGKRAWAGMDAEDSKPFLRRALDLGINFFDTAPSYNVGGSEEVLGECLVGSVPREELVLLSKVGFPGKGANLSGLSRKHIMASIDATLRRLKTDYLDLLVIHRFDPNTPMEETMEALAEVVRSGKVRYLGASSMPARHFIRMQLFAKANGMPAFIAMQNLYNLLYREDEREMIPFCQEEGIGLTPYSPLARGILSKGRDLADDSLSERARLDTQKANEFHVEHTPLIIDAVGAVAEKYGVDRTKVAFSWLLHRPEVTAPLIGATKLKHIDDAVEALDFTLTAEDMALLEAPYRSRSVMS